MLFSLSGITTIQTMRKVKMRKNKTLRKVGRQFQLFILRPIKHSSKSHYFKNLFFNRPCVKFLFIFVESSIEEISSEVKNIKCCAPLTKLPEEYWKQLHSRKFRE